MNELAALKNMVRVGWVSSVNTEERTARVTFEDKGTTFVSGELQVLKTPPKQQGTELTPWMPAVGEYVLCIYLPNGDGDGFVVGGL